MLAIAWLQGSRNLGVQRGGPAGSKDLGWIPVWEHEVGQGAAMAYEASGSALFSALGA
jgi:hypothetical protein